MSVYKDELIYQSEKTYITCGITFLKISNVTYKFEVEDTV